MIYCGKCGTQNDGNNKFCSKCGASLKTNLNESIKESTAVGTEPSEDQNTNRNQTAMNKRRKPFLLIILALIIVSILVGVAVWMNTGSRLADRQIDSGEKYKTEHNDNNTENIKDILSTGQKYLLEENYEAAIVAFEKAIKIDDTCIEAYIGLGDAYTGVNNIEKAIQTYDKAIEIDDINVAAYQDTADAYVKIGETDKAIDILETGYKKTENEQLHDQAKELSNNQSKASEDIAANKLSEPDVITENLEKVNLNKESWKKLNIFFSNFSEAAVPAFKENQLSNDEMILFGVRHNLINYPKRIESYNNQAGYDRRLQVKYVDEAVRKYFGKSIEKHNTVEAFEIDGTVGFFTYDNGYYLIPKDNYQVDPATFPYGLVQCFSHISQLYKYDNDYYLAFVSIYSVFPDQFTGEFYSETPEEWELQNQPDNMPTMDQEMKAKIKKESDGRYILIDYNSL